MRLILNILWLLFGGLFSALGWVLTGCLWCITVVGIRLAKRSSMMMKMQFLSCSTSCGSSSAGSRWQSATHSSELYCA